MIRKKRVRTAEKKREEKEDSCFPEIRKKNITFTKMK